MSQQSALQEMLEEAGHLFLLLPKFHPELNWIEMVWGYVKAYVRERMIEEDFPTLAKCYTHIKNGFDRVTTGLCRKFQRLSLRWIEALKVGAYGMLGEWLVKKYMGHRALPPGWQKEIMKWLESEEKILALPIYWNCVRDT